MAELQLPFNPNDLLRAVRRIDVQTAYGPDIVLNDPFDPNQPANPLLQKLKPQVTMYIGNETITLAPYGKPPPTAWPTIRNVALVGGAFATVGLLYWLSQRSK